ncbi:MAG: transposase [Okeania sp. SIO2C2]|nr:transposase [Okeania sp. SIO2C2]
MPKTLSVRTHSCPKCKVVLDRDENAAINILNKALNEVGIILSACGGLDIGQPVFAQRCASKTRNFFV